LARMVLRAGLRVFAPRGARHLASRAEQAKQFETASKTLHAALAGRTLTADSKADSKAADKLLQAPELAEARAAIKGAPTWAISRSVTVPDPKKKPMTVAVTGAGSAAGTEALFRIAGGMMLGDDQPVSLQIFGADAAVVKELNDCAFPLLSSVKAAGSAGEALKGAECSILLEGDFAAQAKSISGGLVAVMGNANAKVVSENAGKEASVTSITRVTQLAAEQQLAAQLEVDVDMVDKVMVWGEDAVDLSSATVANKWALDMVGEDWAPDTSAVCPGDAADAIVSHMKDWVMGSNGKWCSMGVPAEGDFGLGDGFFYSVPVTCQPGEFIRLGGIPISPALATAMEAQRVALS